MAQELTHPLTRAVYGLDPQSGLVRVEQKGRVGYFTALGEWRSGERLDVDVHLCQWVGGPRPDAKYEKSFKTV